MFVYELDRPWIDTPFLFQGFLIESQDEIDTLKQYCQFVFIDTIVSTEKARDKIANVLGNGRDGKARARQRVEGEPDYPLLERDGPDVPAPSATMLWMQQLRTSYPLQSLAEEELPVAKKIFHKASEAANSIFREAVTTGALNGEKLQESVEDVTESVIRNPDALLLLSYMKRKSSYSYDHAISVSIHLLAFGRHLGLGKDQLKMLGAAGLLLDVGMVRLPETILFKKGHLTPEEYEAMKEHVQFGIEIIHNSSGMDPQIIEIIAQHHERENGSGYPMGLKEREISLYGKMAGIVDCFAALITERPYAQSVAPMSALKMLYNWRKDYFQEHLVEQFIQCLGPYPVGSFVEMNTGEVAVVLEHNRVRRLKPKIMVVLDADKKPYIAPVLLNLINAPLASSGHQYEIKSSVPDGMYDVDLKGFYL